VKKWIEQKLRNLVKIAQVTRPGADDGLDTVSQVEYMGKPTNAAVFYPYGVSANAPNTSSVLLLSIGGSSQNAIGIPFSTENRFRDLKSGEVKIGNFVTKANVFFSEDGSVTIEAGLDGGDITVKNQNGSILMEKDGHMRLENGSGYIDIGASGTIDMNGNATVDP
jgi:phage gp45-like